MPKHTRAHTHTHHTTPNRDWRHTEKVTYLRQQYRKHSITEFNCTMMIRSQLFDYSCSVAVLQAKHLGRMYYFLCHRKKKLNNSCRETARRGMDKRKRVVCHVMLRRQSFFQVSETYWLCERISVTSFITNIHAL